MPDRRLTKANNEWMVRQHFYRIDVDTVQFARSTPSSLPHKTTIIMNGFVYRLWCIYVRVPKHITYFLQRVSIACYVERCISYRKSVRLSVCPSVCPSHAGTVSKRLKLRSWSLKDTSHILYTVCMDSPTSVVRNYFKRYKIYIAHIVLRKTSNAKNL